MEFIEGRTCEHMIQTGKPLHPTVIWSIVRQTASGLLHAQRQKIVHRDVKPANLLLVPPPEGSELPSGAEMVKITDFGLANIDDPGQDQTKLTMADKIIGSPAYMSPEQFGGESVDFRTDIYALGVTAWNLLCDTPPYEGRSITHLMAAKTKRLDRNDTPLSRADDQPAELILRMIDPDPDRRPQSYEEIIQLSDEFVRQPGRVSVASNSIPTSNQNSSAEPLLPGNSTDVTLEFPSGNHQGVHPQRRKRIPLLIAALLACAAAVTGYAIYAGKSYTPGPRDHTRVAMREMLFDGETLSGWDVGGSMVGAWNTVLAPDDSTAVACLSQRGLISRQLQSWDYSRIGVFVWLADNQTIAEIDFGGTSDDKPSGSIRITADEIQLGTKRGDFAATHVMFRRTSPAKLQQRYHVIYIERQATDWFVFFEEQYLGAIPIERISNQDRLTLVVQKPTESSPGAYFSDLMQSRLDRDEDAAENSEPTGN